MDTCYIFKGGLRHMCPFIVEWNGQSPFKILTYKRYNFIHRYMAISLYHPLDIQTRIFILIHYVYYSPRFLSNPTIPPRGAFKYPYRGVRTLINCSACKIFLYRLFPHSSARGFQGINSLEKMKSNRGFNPLWIGM